MTLEQALFNYLSTYAGLVSLLGTRVYPLRLPQGPTYPAITYFKVSNTRVRTMGAPNLGGRPRVQVSCWGETYASAKAVANQVRAALDGYGPATMGGVGGLVVKAVQLENEQDLEHNKPDLVEIALDFTIWHLGT